MKKTNKKIKSSKKKPETVDRIENDIEKSEEEKTDSYDEHGCEFMNEAECEEELEDDGLDVDEVEKKHFGDEE